MQNYSWLCLKKQNKTRSLGHVENSINTRTVLKSLPSSSRDNFGSPQHARSPIAASRRTVPCRGRNPDDSDNAELRWTASGLRVQRSSVSGEMVLGRVEGQVRSTFAGSKVEVE